MSSLHQLTPRNASITATVTFAGRDPSSEPPGRPGRRDGVEIRRGSAARARLHTM
jgi:hypothetical protein